MRPSLRSQKGQMAIFLVLVFQVLFVFFAMTINVGLTVYDKITLQNATDMAAYYAAQRQAELLNQIGHVNYQVRQAFKLLTFRVRVFGSLSVGIPNSTLEKHPLFIGPDISTETQPFFDVVGSGMRPPGVCVGSSLWYEYWKTDKDANVSLCRDLSGFSKVPPTGGGGGVLGGLVGSLDAFLITIGKEIEDKCRKTSVANFQVAAAFLQGYQVEAEKRGKMLDDLAAALSEPAATMKDFRGASVFEGTEKTLRKNVTDAMAENLNVTVYNSLSSDVPGNCSNPQFWLPKVEIFPVVTYVRNSWNGSRCSQIIVPNRSASFLPAAEDLQPTTRNTQLAQTWSSGNSFGYGVEKNPWCMPYMGVKASSQPRKIFAPFGTPTILKAVSFAKPFGGRIGPWYNRNWPSGSATSIGGDKVDPLLPSRSYAGSPGSDTPANDMVNYSKYPGDVHGMNSRYSLGAMSNYAKNNLFGGTMNPAKLPPVFAMAFFDHVGSAGTFETSPNSFATGGGGTPGTLQAVRTMEEAATAPDFFDIIYYSIEGQYFYNYFHPSDEKFHSFLGSDGSPYYLDLGSQNRGPYSLVEQITKTNTVFGDPPAFYMVGDPNQLLTGWAQNSAVNYAFPEASFGKCLKRRDDEMATEPGPGGCPHGGRSGYSIKIVSKNYLNNVTAELGGPGMTGAILNPPGEIGQ